MEIKHVKLDSEESSALLKLIDDYIDITFTVTGDSMFPLWRHKRDSVVLSKCNKNALKKGDIPLYRRKTGQYVIHRIIKVNKDSYNLCGDAQKQIEYNVKAEDIIGVVKTFTRNGKKFDCKNPWVIAYAVLWTALLPFRGVLIKVYRLLIFNKQSDIKENVDKA